MKQLHVMAGILVISTLVTLVSAKTWYLSPTGSDQNDGSSVGSAKFSLVKLADSINPGDIVF